MAKARIALAADHAGYELKAAVRAELETLGYDVDDLGTDDAASVDYPDYAARLTAHIKAGDADRGVLICGSGIGMSIAANRVPGIRAALCHDALTAALARKHNDANVLVLGARTIPGTTALECARVFFATAFEGGRHQRRVAKLT